MKVRIPSHRLAPCPCLRRLPRSCPQRRCRRGLSRPVDSLLRRLRMRTNALTVTVADFASNGTPLRLDVTGPAGGRALVLVGLHAQAPGTYRPHDPRALRSRWRRRGRERAPRSARSCSTSSVGPICRSIASPVVESPTSRPWPRAAPQPMGSVASRRARWPSRASRWARRSAPAHSATPPAATSCAPPIITGFSPPSGAVGDLITVTGIGFKGRIPLTRSASATSTRAVSSCVPWVSSRPTQVMAEVIYVSDTPVPQPINIMFGDGELSSLPPFGGMEFPGARVGLVRLGPGVHFVAELQRDARTLALIRIGLRAPDLRDGVEPGRRKNWSWKSPTSRPATGFQTEFDFKYDGGSLTQIDFFAPEVKVCTNSKPRAAQLLLSLAHRQRVRECRDQQRSASRPSACRTAP